MWLPVHLKDMLLTSSYGEVRKHLGILKNIAREQKKKTHHSWHLTIFRQSVKQCPICVKKNGLTTYTWTNQLTWTRFRSTGGNAVWSATRTPTVRRLWNIHSGNWCIFTIGFCLRVSNQTGFNTAKVTINILTRHTFLPATWYLTTANSLSHMW